MFRGYYNFQQEQGFPWQGNEQAGHHGRHGHHGPHFEGPRGPWGHGYGRPEFTPEQQVLRSMAAEVARLFMIAARSTMGNTERQGQLRSFLERSRTDLLALIGESKSAAQQEGQQPNVEQA